MNPQQWSQVKDRVDALWGRQEKWVKAPTLTADVINLSFEQALNAVQDRMHDRYAPAPGEIIAAIQPDHQPTMTTRPGPEDCTHPGWAIVEYLTDGRRRGVCRVCHLERLFPIGGLLMQWEIEDRRLASQEQEAPY